MIWTLSALAYAALVTVVYCRARRAAARPFADDLRDLWQAARTVEPAKDRAEVIKALAELQKASTPWYERTVSTVGVIAFFSMSIAITVQTIQGNLEEARAQRLGAQLEDMKEEHTAAEEFVAEVSRLVASGMRSAGTLSDLEKRILRYRLEMLERKPETDEDAVREIFALALALREYPLAVSVLEREQEVLNLAVPADRLSLAEYYFLVSSHSASKQLLGEVWAQRQTLARPLVTRLVVLRAALGLSRDAAGELAELLNVSPQEAARILERETAAFRAGVARVDSSTNAAAPR